MESHLHDSLTSKSSHVAEEAWTELDHLWRIRDPSDEVGGRHLVLSDTVAKMPKIEAIGRMISHERFQKPSFPKATSRMRLTIPNRYPEIKKRAVAQMVLT